MPQNTTSLTDKEATSLRRELLEATKEHCNAHLRVAKILFDIFMATTRIGKEEISLPVAWGFESFDDYVEREPEIHYGTARSLIRVYDELCVRRNFDELQLPSSIVKLKQLAKISAADRAGKVNLKKWIGDARDMSCCELEAAVDEALGTGKGKKKNLSFHVQWTKAKVMMKTVKDAREALGVATMGEALTEIVSQWSELHQKTAKLRKKVG